MDKVLIAVLALVLVACGGASAQTDTITKADIDAAVEEAVAPLREQIAALEKAYGVKATMEKTSHGIGELYPLLYEAADCSGSPLISGGVVREFAWKKGIVFSTTLDGNDRIHYVPPDSVISNPASKIFSRLTAADTCENVDLDVHAYAVLNNDAEVTGVPNGGFQPGASIGHRVGYLPADPFFAEDEVIRTSTGYIVAIPAGVAD